MNRQKLDDRRCKLAKGFLRKSNTTNHEPTSKQEIRGPFSPADRLRPVSATRLSKLVFAEPVPYWGRRIEKGRLILISGWRGVGKSHLVMGLAVSMAPGCKFLGLGPAKPVKVIILDGEMDGPTMQTRLRSTVEALGVETPALLKFVSPEFFSGAMPNLATTEGQEEMNEALGSDWDVLVIDNYSSFSPGREDADAWMPWARWFLEHRRAGRTVILVHHTGKNGKQRGASNREDHMDVSISLNPPHIAPVDGSLQFILRWEKARHLSSDKKQPMLITYSKDDNGRGVWSKSSDIDGSNLLKTKALELHGNGKSMEAIGKLLGRDKATISRWLKGLKVDQKVN